MSKGRVIHVEVSQREDSSLWINPVEIEDKLPPRTEKIIEEAVQGVDLNNGKSCLLQVAITQTDTDTPEMFKIQVYLGGFLKIACFLV